MQTLCFLLQNVPGQDLWKMVASENRRKSFCSSFDHSFFTTWLPRDWLTNCLTEGHGSWWTVSSFPQGSHCSSHRRCLRTLIPIRGGPDLWGPARLFRNTGGQDCRVTQWNSEESGVGQTWIWILVSSYVTLIESLHLLETLFPKIYNWDGKSSLAGVGGSYRENKRDT